MKIRYEISEDQKDEFRQGYPFSIDGMRIEYNDAGRELDGYTRQGDCHARAIAILTKRNYRDVMGVIHQITGNYPEMGLSYTEVRVILGDKYIAVDCKKKDEITVKDVLKNVRNCIIYCNTRKEACHVFAVIDGYVQDTRLNEVRPDMVVRSVIVRAGTRVEIKSP